MTIAPLRPIRASDPSPRPHPHDDSPDTSAAFAAIAALPDGPERDGLCRETVEAWLPMAVRLARRFRDRGESMEDLTQVAALGLVKAVARYEPARGNPFAAYAVPTVVGEIKRHFRDYTWDTHVPRRVQELRNQVRTAWREIATNLDDQSPDVARVAEHTGLSEEEVRTGVAALDAHSALSLDARTHNSQDGYALLDTLGERESAYDRVIDREAVKPMLSRLPERERRVLYLRFFGDLTQEGIAEQLGISQMHVSRIISRTCATLRRQVMAGIA